MKSRAGGYIKVIILTFVSISGLYFPIAKAYPSSPLPDALSKFDLSPWQSYGENLKNCTISEFVLLDPVAFYVVASAVDIAQRANLRVAYEGIENTLSKCTLSAKIIGLRDHKCEVIIGPLSATAINSATSLRCQFDEVDRSIISQTAKELVKTTKQMPSYEAAIQATVRACTPNI